MKAPYFPLFVNNWLGSSRINSLSPEEENAYFRLLLYEWNDDTCSLPSDDKSLSSMSRLGAKWNDSKSSVLSFFELHNGRYYNEKLLSLRQRSDELRAKQSQKGVKGMLSRWKNNQKTDNNGYNTAITSVIKTDNTAITPTVDNTSTYKEEEKIAVTVRKPTQPAHRIKIADDSWIQGLRPDCVKQGINIDKELIAMNRWLSLRPGRKLTQRFVINWLNKCDKAIQAYPNTRWNPAAQGNENTIANMNKELERSKKMQMEALK